LKPSERAGKGRNAKIDSSADVCSLLRFEGKSEGRKEVPEKEVSLKGPKRRGAKKLNVGQVTPLKIVTKTH